MRSLTRKRFSLAVNKKDVGDGEAWDVARWHRTHVKDDVALLVTLEGAMDVPTMV